MQQRSTEHPRYNVVSARLSNEEFDLLHIARAGTPQSEYVRQAVLEKIKRDQTKDLEGLKQ